VVEAGEFSQPKLRLVLEVGGRERIEAGGAAVEEMWR
jgi:hypothetical protein